MTGFGRGLIASVVLLAAGCSPTPDFCPFDPDKTEAGICGCGVSDLDSDSDTVPDCNDVCDGGDDRENHDGDLLPDGCDADLHPCDSEAECDDGLDCTEDECDDDGLCRTTPNGVCDWPAEGPEEALNLTPLEGSIPNGFQSNLSAAAWNPVTETLWVGSNGGPARIWAVDLSDPEDPEIPTDGGDRAEWGEDVEFGDLEALTFVDFNDESLVYALSEDNNTITAWDLHKLDDAEDEASFDLSGLLPEPGEFDGAEGLTFVPDRFLTAQRFTNGEGDRVQSVGGMDGLMFVGHQADGDVYVFDLDPSSGEGTLVGRYETGADSTAGLEFDQSTGLLYIWHGGNDSLLEVARVSSGSHDGNRVLDALRIYAGPDVPEGGSTNREGFAIVGAAGCDGGRRDAFMTTDDGGLWSLLGYRDFPCD